MPSVEERLRRLETSNLRLRLALAAGLACFVGCEGVKANYERLTVHELVIVDANEKPLARFVGTPRGAELSLVRPSGAFETLLDARGVLQSPKP